MWKVVCFDTFAGEFYGESLHETEASARVKAEKERREIIDLNPNAGGIQDRVYLIDPDGRQSVYYQNPAL